MAARGDYRAPRAPARARATPRACQRRGRWRGPAAGDGQWRARNTRPAGAGPGGAGRAATRLGRAAIVVAAHRRDRGAGHAGCPPQRSPRAPEPTAIVKVLVPEGETRRADRDDREGARPDRELPRRPRTLRRARPRAVRGAAGQQPTSKASSSRRPTKSMPAARPPCSCHNQLEAFSERFGPSSTRPPRARSTIPPTQLLIVASMIEREAGVPARQAADRRRHLQPPGAQHAARDRRHAPLRARTTTRGR